jgi:hypothetical protein
VFPGYEKGGIMEESKRVFVSIYCKIFTDCFSQEMIDRMATGDEIYEFLMKDAGLSEDEENSYQKIPGDCNLWYLGCNEKFGFLKYQNICLDWGFGESSFNRVEAYLTFLYLDKVFTKEQFDNLMARIQEGRQIDCMYDIKNYLIAKKKGIPWTKTKDAEKFRSEIKEYIGRVMRHLEKEGYQIVFPAKTRKEESNAV